MTKPKARGDKVFRLAEFKKPKAINNLQEILVHLEGLYMGIDEVAQDMLSQLPPGRERNAAAVNLHLQACAWGEVNERILRVMHGLKPDEDYPAEVRALLRNALSEMVDILAQRYSTEAAMGPQGASSLILPAGLTMRRDPEGK